jgi:hypothetical protein
MASYDVVINITRALNAGTRPLTPPPPPPAVAEVAGLRLQQGA